MSRSSSKFQLSLTAFLVWVGVSAAACAQYQAKPLPVDTQQTRATTTRKWVDETLELVRAEIPRYVKEQNVRENLLAYYKAMLPVILDGYRNSLPPWTSDPLQSDRMFKGSTTGGTKDPFFVAVSTLFGVGGSELSSGGNELFRALSALRDSSYPPCWLIAVGFEASRRNDRSSRDAFLIALTGLEKAVQTPNITTSQRRLVATLTWHYIDRDVFSIEWLRILRERLKNAPNADPWLVHFLSGLVSTEEAWESRGGDFAPFVTDQGWIEFEQHLAEAKEHLQKAWELQPDCPEPAVAMIKIAMAGHVDEGESARLWFDRAVACEFDAIEAYKALQWSLWPRWGGSHEEMIQFGEECARTERHDTIVPWQFLEAVHDIGEDTGDYRAAFTLPRVWEIGSAVLEKRMAFLESTKQPGAYNYNGTALHALAWWNHNWSSAPDSHYSRFKLDDKSTHRGALRYFHAESKDLAIDRAMHFGPIADFGNRAEAAAARGDWAESKHVLQEALALLGPEPSEARTACLDKLHTATWQAALRSGNDWVPLPFDETFSGWRPSESGWVLRNGALFTKSLYSTLCEFRLAGEVPRRFHLRFCIEVANANTRPFNFRIGTAFLLDQSFEPDPRVELSFLPGMQHKVRLDAPIGGEALEFTLDPWRAGPQQVDLLVWDDLFVVKFNDQRALRGPFPADGDGDEWRPGCGLSLFTSRAIERYPVAFSQIQIRRIDRRPPMSLLEDLFPGFFERLRAIFGSTP